MFVYKLNNFTAFVNIAEAPHEFYNLVKFLGQCKLFNAMTEAPVLICELIEEVWTTATYNTDDKVLTFNLKGNSYSVNADVLSACLYLPVDTHTASPTKTEIRTMLGELNYDEPEANLGKIVRKNLRKEWSYFFDCLIKVFTGKICKFDAITQVVQKIAYGVIYNHFHKLGETIIGEIGFQLCNTESRPKNIYFARFFMLLAKNIAPGLVLNHT